MHDSYLTRPEEPAPADELGRRHRDVRAVRADEDPSGRRSSRHEHRARSLVDDFGRHRAEERFLDSSMPPGAKDDQIGSDLSCRVDDDRGRAALDQPGRDIQPVLLQTSGGLLEKGLAVGPQAVPQVVGGDIGDARSPWAAVPIGLRREDGQDHELAPDGQAKLPPFRARAPIRWTRRSRAVPSSETPLLRIVARVRRIAHVPVGRSAQDSRTVGGTPRSDRRCTARSGGRVARTKCDIRPTAV